MFSFRTQSIVLCLMLLLAICVPDRVSAVEPPAQQMVRTGPYDESWERGIHEYVRELDQLIIRARAEYAAGGQAAALYAEYAGQMNEAPMTLGPGNAALAKYREQKDNELQEALGLRYFEKITVTRVARAGVIAFLERLPAGTAKHIRVMRTDGDQADLDPAAPSWPDSFTRIIFDYADDRDMTYGRYDCGPTDGEKLYVMFAIHSRERYDRVRKLFTETVGIPLAVFVSFDPARDCVAGGLVTAKLDIINVSSEIVDVLGCGSTSPEGGSVGFVKTEYGQVSYDAAGDVYRHNTMAQMASPTPFHNGVLVPGDSLTASVSFVADGAGTRVGVFTVAYQALVQDKIQDVVYAAGPGSADPPRTTYQPLRHFGAAAVPLNHVIIRDGTELPGGAIEAVRGFHSGPRADISLPEARGELGINASRAYFSAWLASWVLEADGKTYLYGGRLKGGFAEADLASFMFIDACGEQVPIRFADELAGEYPPDNPFGIAGHDAMGMGYAGSMAKDRLWDFFLHLKEKGCRSSVTSYYLDSRCLYLARRSRNQM